jgi:alpha-N-acetylglucosamine transferase
VFIIGLTTVLGVILLLRYDDLPTLTFDIKFKNTSRIPEHEDIIENIPGRNYSKEAYVTLLSPGDPHPWSEGKPDFYFEACKIKAHRLLRNTTTRDPHHRPFIVLVTDRVPPQQIDILEQHGAIVKPVATLPPPTGTNADGTNPRYRDQFTKFHVWNMTDYDRIAFFDADTLFIRPIHSIFDTPTQTVDDEEWLFAAVYDSGVYGRRNPPGYNDTGGPDDNDLNAGVFLLRPSIQQSEYIFSRYYNPPPHRDFTRFMEQDFLRWAYNDNGKYPWIRLSHLFNTQWPRDEDLDSALVLHDKMWNRPMDDELRRMWYFAWGEMAGWAAARYRDGIHGLEEEFTPVGNWTLHGDENGNNA